MQYLQYVFRTFRTVKEAKFILSHMCQDLVLSFWIAILFIDFLHFCCAMDQIMPFFKVS